MDFSELRLLVVFHFQIELLCTPPFLGIHLLDLLQIFLFCSYFQFSHQGIHKPFKNPNLLQQKAPKILTLYVALLCIPTPHFRYKAAILQITPVFPNPISSFLHICSHHCTPLSSTHRPHQLYFPVFSTIPLYRVHALFTMHFYCSKY